MASISGLPWNLRILDAQYIPIVFPIDVEECVNVNNIVDYMRSALQTDDVSFLELTLKLGIVELISSAALDALTRSVSRNYSSIKVVHRMIDHRLHVIAGSILSVAANCKARKCMVYMRNRLYAMGDREPIDLVISTMIETNQQDLLKELITDYEIVNIDVMYITKCAVYQNLECLKVLLDAGVQFSASQLHRNIVMKYYDIVDVLIQYIGQSRPHLGFWTMIISLCMDRKLDQYLAVLIKHCPHTLDQLNGVGRDITDLWVKYR